MYNRILLFLLVALMLPACQFLGVRKPGGGGSADKIRVVFDTDANNELDDQHALAYLLFNGDRFDVEGVTVNATVNGGAIDEHYREAERVLKLSTLHPDIPLLRGANGRFAAIASRTGQSDFDGVDAVDFIIERALEDSDRELVLLAVGKLTNVALALKKNPGIADKMTVYWLGSNYPHPGEYNQGNDVPAMNFVLDSDVPFSIVTVRYGQPSGTDAVRVTLADIQRHMPGRGPRTDTPVTGRHGVAFSTFGDYSVNLFEHINFQGDPPSRALFDMAAVAILKNPRWASSRLLSAPTLLNDVWVDRPNNARKIVLWEDFDESAILADFFDSVENYKLVSAD